MSPSHIPPTITAPTRQVCGCDIALTTRVGVHVASRVLRFCGGDVCELVDAIERARAQERIRLSPAA